MKYNPKHQLAADSLYQLEFKQLKEYFNFRRKFKLEKKDETNHGKFIQDQYYLIEKNWLHKWKELVGYEELSSFRLNRDLEDTDYNLFMKIINNNKKGVVNIPLDNSNIYLSSGEINPFAEFVIINKACHEMFKLSKKNKINDKNERSIPVKFLKDKIILYFSESTKYICFRNTKTSTDEEFIIIFQEEKNKDKILTDIEQGEFLSWLEKRNIGMDGPDEFIITEQECHIKIINKNLKLKTLVNNNQNLNNADYIKTGLVVNNLPDQMKNQLQNEVQNKFQETMYLMKTMGQNRNQITNPNSIYDQQNNQNINSQNGQPNNFNNNLNNNNTPQNFINENIQFQNNFSQNWQNVPNNLQFNNNLNNSFNNNMNQMNMGNQNMVNNQMNFQMGINNQNMPNMQSMNMFGSMNNNMNNFNNNYFNPNNNMMPNNFNAQSMPNLNLMNSNSSPNLSNNISLSQNQNQFPNNNNINASFNANQNPNQKQSLFTFGINYPHKAGLINVGQSCYMNATIECLSNIKSLSNKLLENYGTYNVDSQPLCVAYSSLLYDLFHTQEKCIRPQLFKEIIGKLNPLFEGNHAADAKDLIFFLIETLHKELLPPSQNEDVEIDFYQQEIDSQFEDKMFQNFYNEYSKKTTIVSNIFYGINRSVMYCQGCNKYKYSFQIFNILIFPLKKVKDYKKSKKGWFDKLDLNLYDAFDCEQEVEKLEGENMIYCNRCRKLSPGTHQQQIYGMPPILIIILNRGKNNEDFNEEFQFDEILDFTNRNNILNQQSYKKFYLCGIITHLGESGSGGHFIAYCRNSPNENFMCYNDASVVEVSLSDAMATKISYRENEKKTPYILLYHNMK